MLQRVDLKLTFHISDLQTKLEKVKQRAERSLRKENHRLNDRQSVDSDIDVDNIFGPSGGQSDPPVTQNEVESILTSETISVASEREREPLRSSLINDVSEIRELINKSLNGNPPPLQLNRNRVAI